MPANVALLGSGLFAANAYLPALTSPSNTPHLTLHTLWSRSQNSVSSLSTKASELKVSPTPKQLFGDDGLDQVLADEDIDCVMIVLPISAQPDFVRKALKAGKHVLSEKPVGKDVDTAKSLIEEYEREYKPKGLIWRVAENWAHEPIVWKAAEALRNSALGPVLYYELRAEGHIPDGSSYQSTQWRTIPDYQGGFLLDGGVHTTSLLRTVLPNPPSQILSTSSLHRAHLPPHDTILALALPSPSSSVPPYGPPTKLKVPQDQSVIPTSIGKSSAQGTLLLTFASPDVPSDTRLPGGLRVTCLNGTVSVLGSRKGTWELTVTPAEGSDVKAVKESGQSEGVAEEIGMFCRAVEAVKGGQEVDEKNHGEPRGALWDLAVIQAMLSSEGKVVDLDALVKQ